MFHYAMSTHAEPHFIAVSDVYVENELSLLLMLVVVTVVSYVLAVKLLRHTCSTKWCPDGDVVRLYNKSKWY